MEINNRTSLPDNFLLDITNIPGSSDDVCLTSIEHYRDFLYHPDPIVANIAQAMIGNLTEYYNISHKGSLNFELALPHLSEMANFMDSKNTPQMDIESTARIKSFYSLYEKLLMECSDRLEKKTAIPTSGLAYDIIATRDVIHPRYQFRLEPENFYRHVYGLILDISKPKILNFEPDSNFTIPKQDFVAYALNIKGIPEVYRYITSLPPSLNKDDIYREIQKIRNADFFEDTTTLPIVKALKSQVQKEGIIDFRNSLENELLQFMSPRKKMLQDYRKLPQEEFLYVYGTSLYPEYRDFIRIINYLDSSIKNGNYDLHLNFDDLITGGEISEHIICNRLNYQANLQEAELELRVCALCFDDLGNFDQNFEQATLINHFAACSKDYMRYPKSSGYQSFHVIVTTPFGNFEKQFRTAAQNELAEYGSASHSNSYKPYEKENFHRLKICTPLMPARDKSGDIITPIKLEPLDFASAIKAYYHQDFSFFSDGLSLDEFSAAHPDDFDEAFLALSDANYTEGMLDRVFKAFDFLKTFDFFKAFEAIKGGAKHCNRKISLVKGNENEKDKEKTKNIYTPHDNINSINNNLNITTPIDRNTEKKPKGDPKSYEDRN